MGETIARSLTTEYRAYHRARERLVWYGLPDSKMTMKYAEFVERGLKVEDYNGNVVDEHGNEYRDEQGLAHKLELTKDEAETLSARLSELYNDAMGYYLDKTDFDACEWLDTDEANEYESLCKILG